MVQGRKGLRYGAGNASDGRFEPDLPNMPDLPIIDFGAVGQEPPRLLRTPSRQLPIADVVVMTWTDFEWAAMQHVFVSGSTGTMPYRSRSKGSWPGWRKDDRGIPTNAPDGWDFWGYYRLVEVGGRKVLLYKSNTHLTWPGKPYLERLTSRLAMAVAPEVIYSIGTAGGTRLEDALGTVNFVSAATYAGDPNNPATWTTYSCGYTPNWRVLDHRGFSSLLFDVPSTRSNLRKLANEYNRFYHKEWSLKELNVLGLDHPASPTVVNNLTPNGVALLTTAAFIVGQSDGRYSEYGCIEMDDAIIASIAGGHGSDYCFVRNVSDPVQNTDIAFVQSTWGGALTHAYGIYTSYNGALATWAALAGMENE